MYQFWTIHCECSLIPTSAVSTQIKIRQVSTHANQNAILYYILQCHGISFRGNIFPGSFFCKKVTVSGLGMRPEFWCVLLTWLHWVISLADSIISSALWQSCPSSAPPSTAHTPLWSRTMELRRWTGQPPEEKDRKFIKNIRISSRRLVRKIIELWKQCCLRKKIWKFMDWNQIHLFRLYLMDA